MAAKGTAMLQPGAHAGHWDNDEFQMASARGDDLDPNRKPLGSRSVALITTVQDYLGYGYLSGQVCHGYCGCTRCRDDTTYQ